MLHVPLVRIRTYLKTALTYKYIILDTCHPDIIFV